MKSTTTSATTKPSDPCEKYLNNYLECVDSHTNGLGEHDCQEEVKIYKSCRAENSKKTLKK
jgi:hypothetical protein